MAIACVSIYVWRKIRPAAAPDDPYPLIVEGAHAFLGLTMLYYYAELIDGFKWLYNTIAFNPFRPPEVFCFRVDSLHDSSG